MCVINVRIWLVVFTLVCWSRSPCPNLIGSVNLNHATTEARRKREAKAQAAKCQTNNYDGQSLSESKKIKARELQVHMCANLVPRPSPPPTACICILQATKNWSRGKHGNKITSIPHAYVYYPRTRTWVRGYKDQLPTQTIYRAARVWAFTTACRAGRSN